jgi:hypothetical protein
MLVVMQSRAAADDFRAICDRVEALGWAVHPLEGGQRFDGAAIGEARLAPEVEAQVARS